MMIYLKRGFIRYKGLHVLLWMILSALILLIYYNPKAAVVPQWLAALLITGLSAIPAYYGAYRLVPRLLYQKKIGPFIALLMLAAAANSIFTYLFVGTLYNLVAGGTLFPSVLYVVYMLSIFFVTNNVVITVSCAIKIISDRFRIETRLQDVEQEKVSTELAFLRAQINPHFLFNVINTIYFQIHKENTEARSSVEKLSEMLRYQLYECTTDKIDIAKELTYIENYVAVQQLRMEPGTDVQIDIQKCIVNFRIAPLLILPIVENAFKHISHYKNPVLNKLRVSLHTESDTWFVINVSNTYDGANGAKHLLASGGLGLQNIRRRLELLYPDAHTLDIQQHPHTYETTLKVRYHD